MVLWRSFVSKRYLLRLVDIVTKFCFVREFFAGRVIIRVNRHMASRYNLPPPGPLEIHGVNAAERWKKFKRVWNNYSIAIEVNTKSEQVQVATLLTVIGEEAREVFATFAWESEGDEKKIATVLDKFGAYCQLRRNIPFERYRFNRRTQEPGESYEQY